MNRKTRLKVKAKQTIIYCRLYSTEKRENFACKKFKQQVKKKIKLKNNNFSAEYLRSTEHTVTHTQSQDMQVN